MVSEEQRRTPQNQKNPTRLTNPLESGENLSSIFSPRFKSAAAMAGWDEEALLFASLVVEDTPDRDFKHKRRSDLNFKTPPPTNSRRKRRAQRSPQPIPVAVLDLDFDEEETPREESGKNKKENKTSANEDSKIGGDNNISTQKSSTSSSSSSSPLPCIDKLREELSCAICLEICFEPSTTPCGHSFCRKCLRSAADKCGKKCPKCRQLMSNGRSCSVNTVLWNTIQLLFPKEVEGRKAAGALNNREAQQQHLSPQTAFYSNLRNGSTQTLGASRRTGTASSRRRGITTTQVEDDGALARRMQRETEEQRQHEAPSSSSSRGRTRRGITTTQDEDAALALRLQREEFMQAFRESQVHGQSSSSVSLARANLRVMASRAINIRIRDRRI